MTLHEAFKNLMSAAVWERMPEAFRKKYKSYRSKYTNRKVDFSDGMKRRILLDSKMYSENWIPLVRVVSTPPQEMPEDIKKMFTTCGVCGEPIANHKKVCIPV